MKKIFSSLQSLLKSALYRQYVKQIFLYFSFPCIFFCAIICFLYVSHNNYVQSSSAENTFLHIEESISNMLDEIHNKYATFHSNPDIRIGMFFDSDNFYAVQNYDVTSKIKNQLSDSVSTSNYIDSVYLYSFNSNYVYAYDASSAINSNYLHNFTDTKWYDAYNENPIYRRIIGYYNDTYKCNMISVIYQVNFNNYIPGVLVFNIPEYAIRNIIKTDTSQNADILIKSADGRQIYSTFGDNVVYDFNMENNSVHMEKNSYVKSSTIALWGLNILMSSSFNSTMQILPFVVIIVMIMVITFLIPFFISMMLASKFYNSIAKIAAYLQEFEVKDDYADNELEYIYINLQEALKSAKNTEYIIAKNVSQLHQAQLVSLQTQLNPHFLFNVLNTLSIMNSTHTDEDKFEILVKNLSNLLEYCLNTSDSTVYMDEEIKYTKYYIQIEEIKYQTELNIIWDIPDELMRFSIPRFSFQPIIENALKHGFKYNFNDKSTITIHVRKKENNIIISITDNGCGMTVQQLASLRAQLDSGIFPQSKKIGIANLNKRIRLLFGNKYGCCVYSRLNAGTTVQIITPSLFNSANPDK